MNINFSIPNIYNINRKNKNISNIQFKGNDNKNNSFTIEGSKTSAKVYTGSIDYQTIAQIKEFCSHPVFKDMPIRIMPDTHAGINSVVGFSAPVNPSGSVIPAIIGGDIGCGMLCVQIDTLGKDIDFKKLDNVIRTSISTKRTKNIEKLPLDFEKQINDLYKYKYKKTPENSIKSLGTLGGGNHFIEIDNDSSGNHYLVIHTGSRHFGKETAEYHQNTAEKQNPYKIKKLSYLSGKEAKDYLEDMQIAIKYAKLNRRTIADEIISKMGWKEISSFESVHNYISDDGIIRKGAISANDSENLIIPLNMRDGALLGKGKGNKDWNNTAPHGAGRQYSRSKAKSFISFEDYKNSMKGIYTSCISESNIDEAPQAYKDSCEIIDNIKETADITEIISPVYNYKD